MKSRFFKTILLALLIGVGIWALSNRDQISSPGDVVELVSKQLSVSQIGFTLPFGSRTQNESPDEQLDGAEYVGNVIRVASLKLSKTMVASGESPAFGRLAEICRRADVVAIQGVGADDDQWLQKLTARLNHPQGNQSNSLDQNIYQYSYVSGGSGSPSKIAPVTRRLTSGAQVSEVGMSIVFNQRTLELDRSQSYLVNDPDRLFLESPWVGCFRTRGPETDTAFTFSLVQARLVPALPGSELTRLNELFRAVRNDGRGEDDIIIAGEFRITSESMRSALIRTGTRIVASQTADSANPTASVNLVFNEFSTVESTGRGGAFDFLGYYNLGWDEARAISDQMPVWVEFSVFEGNAKANSNSVQQHQADPTTSNEDLQSARRPTVPQR